MAGRLKYLLCATAAGAAVAGATAPAANATDSYPCGGMKTVTWTSDKVQPCELVGLTANGAPLYTSPVAVPEGQQPPAPAAWLSGAGPNDFVCERQFPNAWFHHPSGWWNNWWAYTRSTDGKTWGWVSEAYFKGGANNEPDGGWDNIDAGLRPCPPPPWPTAAPQPPADPVPDPDPVVPDPGAPTLEDQCETTPATPDLKLRVVVRAAVNRHSTSFVTTGYGRRFTVRGRLTHADGTPVPGVPLCVVRQNEVEGAGMQPSAPVVTDADGRFRYLVGRGPSRRLWFVYRSGDSAAVSSVVVRVRAPVTLAPSRHALRTGDSVELRGRLGWELPGVLVELQAQRGRRWQTFATTRVDKETRFRVIYRFTRTTGTQRYHLRARIPAQPGLPFTHGSSRPVVLRVSG